MTATRLFNMICAYCDNRGVAKILFCELMQEAGLVVRKSPDRHDAANLFAS